MWEEIPFETRGTFLNTFPVFSKVANRDCPLTKHTQKQIKLEK